ncbi:hypothetical protein GGI16_004761 [Coemansia sp. S142-1]|nr:hypothetical protein LPJ71_001555 [Coemansia sp. S17]KAJ2096748.1 hypothetical protein GGI16_004761 [Coemansia sp. S142-1]
MKLFSSVFITIAIAAASVQAAKPTLYVFGDSLSDVGTLKQLTLGLVPPNSYWQGRFSSGPVWNEYLAKLLDYNLYNKAIGGSTSDNKHSTLIDVLNINIPSTQDQINFFKFTNPLYILDGTRSKDIVVLEVGPNDFFAELNNLVSGALSVNSFIDILSNTVVSQLEQLRKAGFKNFIVANLAAIQYTPYAGQHNARALAATTVNAYNQQLAVKANAWARSASGLGFFAVGDIGGFVESTINSPAVISALGLADIANPCIEGINTDSIGGLLASIMNCSNNPSCPDASKHYFFDPIHPNERVHRLYGYFGKELVSALFQGSTYNVTEPNLLSLISKNNLGTPAPKPVSV